jgi:peptidoglycan-N-acetylmuramic acid deacetylase
MKVIKIILVVLCISLLFCINSRADDGCNWYIVKRGHDIPGFPENADVVSQFGGKYIGVRADDGCKKIYLTFDAGYENGNIEKILDVMKDEGVHGAFFILSNLIRKNPDLVRRMVDEGHLVCNHTSNHKDLTRLSDSEILANLSRLEDEYKALTGRDMEKIFRFPEGRYSLHTLRLLNENGYTSIFWSMAYDDWDNSRQMDKERAKEKLLSTTHDGAILLLHPTSATNAAILGDLIHEWRNMGYSFGSLKEI